MRKKVTMSEIGGYDYQKQEAEKIIDFFKNYDVYTKNGATLPRGIVFYGEPGNGKTMFANAIAGDSNVKVFTIEESYVLDDSLSIGGELIRTFRAAKEAAPSVIILDEIDQIIECNNGYNSPSDEEKNNLRILLTEIDNLDKSGVLVIATGNVDIDELPSALVRNGRIEKHIYIGDPDFKDRTNILEMFLNSSPEIFENIKAVEIAKLTQGLTCASLKSLVNDVLIKCLANGHKKAKYQDFHDPIQVILSHGIKRKNPVDNDHVVYHELGHLVVDYVLNNRIGFVSVESYGRIGGMYRPMGVFRRNLSILEPEEPEDGNEPKTLQEFTNKNTVSIAGLVATEIFMGERYVGAVGDLLAIKRSYENICANGLLSFDEFVAALPRADNHPIYKDTIKDDLMDLSKYLNDLYESAKAILTENKVLVEKLYAVLKKKKTLTSEEVEEIIKN